jgi:hypothetical protein
MRYTMDRMKMLGLMVVALFVVACAVTPVEIAPTPGPCLPPGGSLEVFGWPVVDVRVLRIHTDDGESLSVVAVHFEREGRRISVVWSTVGMLAYNPDAKDPYGAIWIDAGILDDQGRIRKVPRDRCQWVQRNFRSKPA